MRYNDKYIKEAYLVVKYYVDNRTLAWLFASIWKQRTQKLRKHVVEMIGLYQNDKSNYINFILIGVINY